MARIYVMSQLGADGKKKRREEEADTLKCHENPIYEGEKGISEMPFPLPSSSFSHSGHFVCVGGREITRCLFCCRRRLDCEYGRA